MLRPRTLSGLPRPVLPLRDAQRWSCGLVVAQACVLGLALLACALWPKAGGALLVLGAGPSAQARALQWASAVARVDMPENGNANIGKPRALELIGPGRWRGSLLVRFGGAGVPLGAMRSALGAGLVLVAAPDFSCSPASPANRPPLS